MKKTFFALVALLALASCHKDKSRTALLTDHCWIITGITSDPAIDVNGTSVTDIYAQQDACSKDNVSCLEPDGTYTTHEGASRCNATDPQIIFGIWSFNSDETVLTITPDIGSTITEAEIVELTESTLRFRTLISEVNGIKYFFTFTLKPA